ncbi:MAG: MBL fold metallo-hydrolase, partial [Promethearchaeota archaeon]
MVQLEPIADHAVVDTITQQETRSCVLGGISLGKYAIAVETGDSLEVGVALRKALEQAWEIPVKYWFLSHTHNDHRGGYEAFRDATLIASRRCLENMPKRIRLGRWPQEVFDEQRVLEDDLSIHCFQVGGHSVGHSVVYVPQERILFGCDLFIVQPVNFGLPFMSYYQNNPKQTGNPEEYLMAFKKFKALEIDIIVPGHGHLVRNPQQYLDEQIVFFKDLKASVMTAIDEGTKLEEFAFPRVGPIAQAYQIAEARRQRSRNLRFLENYLLHLKTSFYNYYQR